MTGLFVVFEGGDGVGKSTQVGLLADWARARGREVVVTFEPGDTAVGKEVRRIVLDPATGDLAPRAEALLYAADKAHHVATVVTPALARGAIVICDRYVDSMIAYQGAGRVLNVREIAGVARWATEGLEPDLTVLLDLDPAEAVATKEDPDRLEAAGDDFHQRARQHFLALAQAEPERYLVLPARESRRVLANRIRDELLRRFPTLGSLSEASGRLTP